MLLYDMIPSGFRENHSCQTALIRLVDDWISNEVVGTLLLDLSKAFDLVNHSLLLQNYIIKDYMILQLFGLNPI